MSGATDQIRESEIRNFAALLRAKGPEVLTPGTYPHRYLQHITHHALYYSHVYAQLLNLLLASARRSRKELSLLDYGAGNGLLGLLACYTGFGTVYLNDQDSVFLSSARQLAAAFGLHPAGCIEGGAGQVLSFFSGRRPPDLLAGSDVIEHIYDLPGFIHALHPLNPQLLCALSTACNPFNPLLQRRFRNIQLRDEWEGGTPDIHPLFAGAPIEPFRVIRARIIRETAQGRLTEQEVEKLVQATRGLIQADIVQAVRQYLHTGTLPPTPLHPTNTCDPLTGSWSERMLSVDEYRVLFRQSGFSLSIHDGFYNQYDKGTTCLLRWMANRFIPFSGHRMAPYIVLMAEPAQVC